MHHECDLHHSCSVCLSRLWQSSPSDPVAKASVVQVGITMKSLSSLTRTAIALSAAVVMSPASAVTVLNLTTAGSSGTINGSYFEQILPRATGTGVIDSFAEIGGNTPQVQGFNTTVNHVEDNGSSDQFNHELKLSDVPIVVVNGVTYRQFMLDVNQTGESPLLSLDELKIYQSNTANFGSTAALLAGSTLRWDMDGAGDAWIKLDYSLNTGSGSGDMFAYIRDDVFNSDTYVYLWSRFGDNISNNDGFEEWAVTTAAPIPEPSTYALMFAGLAAVGFMARRRQA